MRTLIWTASALRDLEHIDAWLSSEADPEVAIRILVAIKERANFLLEFPLGGPPLEEETHALRVRGTNYSLVYRLPGDERIEILRIFHARQDWRPA
jgi:toxin ParE1/3/4